MTKDTNKYGKTRNITAAALIIAALSVSCQSGGASSTGFVPDDVMASTGRLILTGIPEEFNGVIPQLVALTVKGSPQRYLAPMNPYPVVTDGELTLPLFEKTEQPSSFLKITKIAPYNGTETCDLRILLSKMDASSKTRRILDTQFKAVRFEQGMAAIPWSAGVAQDAPPGQAAGIAQSGTARGQTAGAVQSGTAPGQAQSGAAVVQLVQLVQTQSVNEEDFQIRQNAQGGVTITGYTGQTKRVAIPATISGLKVTEIGRNAFVQQNLTSLSLPDGLTAIGDAAFAINNIGNLVIPDSVTRIGIAAFYRCGIRTLTLGKGIRYIEGGSFAYNVIEDLVIPDWVVEIGSDHIGTNNFANSQGKIITNEGATTKGAFMRNAIKTLKLGKGLVKIGESAFSDNKITALTFPASLKEIGDDAFFNNQLTTLVIPQGITSVGQRSFRGNPLVSAVIPPSLVNFKYAFGNNGRDYTPGPTSITLPANIGYNNAMQFGEGFINYYNLQGQKAGTYVYANRIWTRQ